MHCALINAAAKITKKKYFILPKLMVCECEKLPLGLAPPTMSIVPFPSSSEGINVHVWPTVTPGALPLGIREYLSIAKKVKLDRKFPFLHTARLLNLNLLTRLLLWVYLLGRALEEAPWLINTHSTIYYFLFQSPWHDRFLRKKQLKRI